MMAAVCLMLLPALLLRAPLFHDDLGLDTYPKLVFLARCFQQGFFPLWDPHTWCGSIPFFARYFTETYYAPVWPLLFLARLGGDGQEAYCTLVLLPLVLHLLLAAAGFYRLLRRFPVRCSRPAAAFGAGLYGLSPAFMYAYGWSQVVAQQAWLPWLLVATASAVSRWRGWKISAGAAVFACMITSGSPEFLHLSLWAWGALVGAVLLHAPALRRRTAAAAGGMALGGAALAAVYLFSAFDGQRWTSEPIEFSVRAALADPSGSLPPPLLASIVLPGLLGNLTGASMPDLLPGCDVLYWEANLAGGVFVSLLVFLGLWSARRAPGETGPVRARRIAAAWAGGLFLLAVLAALGSHTPFYEWTIGLVPGLGWMPRPIRYRLLQCLASALLAALGLDWLRGAGGVPSVSRLRRGVAVFLAVSGVCVLASLAWRPAGGPPSRLCWTGKPATGFEGEFHPEDYDAWCGPCAAVRVPGPFWEREGPFAVREPVVRAVRAGAWFNGPSSGRIAVAPSPQAMRDGRWTGAVEYRVDRAGWREFDLPSGAVSGTCLALLAQDKGSRIGIRAGGNVVETDDYSGLPWRADRRGEALCLQVETRPEHRPLLLRLGEPAARPAVAWLLYGLLAAAAVCAAARLLPPGRLGAWVCALACCEVAVTAAIALYGGTFAFGKPAENHRRASAPALHPVVQRAQAALARTGEGFRMAGTQPFADNFARVFGGAALMGYDMHPLETRFKTALERAWGRPANFFLYYGRARPRPPFRPWLDHWAVRVFEDVSPVPLGPGWRVEPLEGFPGHYLQVNARAMPRSYVMDRWRPGGEAAQIDGLLRGDLREAGVLAPEEAARIGLPPDSGVGEAEEGRFDRLQRENPVTDLDLSNPNRVRARVRLARAAMWVLADAWFPGWTAIVDGRPAPVCRVNYCQRGVWVAPGEHAVEMVFRPRSWVWGARVSGTAFFLLLLAAAGPARRRKS